MKRQKRKKQERRAIFSLLPFIFSLVYLFSSHLLILFTLYRGQERLRRRLSSVSRIASETIAVATTMESGSLREVLRRRAIVSFFTALVRSITWIQSERRPTRSSSSPGGSSGLANSSISVITLINRSASLSSSCKQKPSFNHPTHLGAFSGKLPHRRRYLGR